MNTAIAFALRLAHNEAKNPDQIRGVQLAAERIADALAMSDSCFERESFFASVYTGTVSRVG